MTALIVTVIVVTVVAALGDWVGVARGILRLEQIAKPSVMIGLIATSLVVDAEPEHLRWWVVAGLSCGLIGDVLLLPSLDRFLSGLAIFLTGHVVYVAGFATLPLAPIGVVGGMAAALVVVGYLGIPTLRAVTDGPLRVPVIAYVAVSAVLVVVATATHRWPIAAGGVLFAVSDGLLGLDRFVRPAPARRVLVHALYHLGQAGFVIGLVWV